MKWFLSMFSDSWKELKRLNTLTTTGVLIALGIVLELLAARSDTLQIKFSFLAVALVAMLYGPVLSMFAAGVLDIVSGLLSPGSIWPELVLVKILAGLIFGLFLYKAKTPYTSSRNMGENFKEFFKDKQGYLFMLRVILSKFTVNVVCNILLTTLILQMRLSGKTYIARLATSIPKTMILLPVEVALMLIILIPVYNVYITHFKKAGHKAVQ